MRPPTMPDDVQLCVFARFHAAAGREAELAAAIERVVSRSRDEPGCRFIHAFRAARDPALFFIHSRWHDEAAFDEHARLPHTVDFLDVAARLITHDLDVTRTKQIF